MKKLICLFMLCCGSLFAASPVAVVAYRDGAIKTPTNFLHKSIQAGPGIAVDFTSTNGIVQIRATNTTAVTPYASLGMATTNILAVGTGGYTNIANWSYTLTNLFHVNTNTGYLTNLVAGYYRCHISVSSLGVAANLYEMCMLTNDVDSELVSFKKEFSTGQPRYDSGAAAQILFLPANTACSLAIKNQTANGTIAIHRAALLIIAP